MPTKTGFRDRIERTRTYSPEKVHWGGGSYSELCFRPKEKGSRCLGNKETPSLWGQQVLSHFLTGLEHCVSTETIIP